MKWSVVQAHSHVPIVATRVRLGNTLAHSAGIADRGSCSCCPLVGQIRHCGGGPHGFSRRSHPLARHRQSRCRENSMGCVGAGYRENITGHRRRLRPCFNVVDRPSGPWSLSLSFPYSGRSSSGHALRLRVPCMGRIRVEAKDGVGQGRRADLCSFRHSVGLMANQPRNARANTVASE
jgi:hypothetical protein